MQASKLSHRKIVLVTGASSGFGKAIATLLAQEGLTQLFGVVRMIQAVLPIMRQQASGQIINFISSSGLNSVPFHGFYSASKHSLEAYSEALYHEIKPLNIQVSLVEPKAFNTKIQMRSPHHLMPIYERERQKVVDNIEDSIRTGRSPIIVAQLILQILNSSSPRLRYRAGTLAKTFHLTRRFLPEPIYERILRNHFMLDVTTS